MRPIQYLLLAILAGGVAFYFARLRSRVSDRLLATGMSLLAAVGILAPEAATWMANTVGVGRGVDLVMYLSLCTLSYMWVLLYAKERQTQQRMTRLVRALAIRDAVAIEQFQELKKAA